MNGKIIVRLENMWATTACPVPHILQLIWRHAANKLGEKTHFHCETLEEELTIAQKLLWVKKFKHYLHIISVKTFHIWKDFCYLRGTSQVTAACFMRNLIAKSHHSPRSKMVTFSTTEPYWLQVNSYMISTTRM